MKNPIKTITVTAPSHWMSYLLYGDASSFDYYGDEEDEQACYAFSKKYGNCVGAEDAGFLHNPDYGNAAGDCFAYTFIVSDK